jgi:hypothetical protein
VTNPWISRLVALTGLDAEHDRIQSRFLEHLAASLRDASGGPRKSGLTRNGVPVEFGLTFDRGVAAGFKYTVDLFVEEPISNVLDRVHHLTSTVIGSGPAVDALVRSLHVLATSASGSIAALYWSVGYARGEAPRIRCHLVGRNGALNRGTLEQLDPVILPRQRLRLVLAAANSLQKSAVDIACLGPTSDGSLRCKLYVLTDPYIDLKTVTRLALSLGLSTGHALSLIRWYATYLGHHEGRLGAFGVGVDLSSQSGRQGVEAYAYLGDKQLADIRRRIDKQVPRMAPVWGELEREERDGSHLEFTGFGVETASFARLGRMTTYLYPVAAVPREGPVAEIGR